ERQADLRGVPPSRQQRGDGLAPGDLHAEAIEAQRLRPIGLRMRLVAESVASLTGAATGTEVRLRLHARDGARPNSVCLRALRRGEATVKTELLTVVDLPKCLRHVCVLLSLESTLRSGYDRLGHCDEGQRAKGKRQRRGQRRKPREGRRE